MSVAINAGERPRAAAFGSDPRPFLESANGLRPLPAAAAFGRFQGRSLFEVKQEKNGRACQRWDIIPINTKKKTKKTKKKQKNQKKPVATPKLVNWLGFFLFFLVFFLFFLG